MFILDETIDGVMLACSLNPNSKNEPRVAIVAILQEILVDQVVFEKTR